MARNIPILYNEKVTKIEFGENGVIVRTSKDHAYNADAVIFTASLGVLKARDRPAHCSRILSLYFLLSSLMSPISGSYRLLNHHITLSKKHPSFALRGFHGPHHAKAITVRRDVSPLQEDHKSLFSPGLPAEKVKAIEGLGFGYNEKIFVEFENEACSTDPVSQVPCVAYHLLWDIPWPGPQKHQILHNGSAAAKESSVTAEGLPSWVPGMFSFRQVFICELTYLVTSAVQTILSHFCRYLSSTCRQPSHMLAHHTVYSTRCW